MTSKEKVLAVHPDAVCIRQYEKAIRRCSYEIVNNLTDHVRLGRAIGRESSGWADAARNLKKKEGLS